jgi:hypothetical protein
VKFTIHGFSQEKLLEYGLDANDALLLRWMVDFSGSPKIRTVQQEGFTYYWIKYDAVLEDLPILTIKTAKGIGKKFLIFAEKGILVKYTERTVSGSYSCFRFTDVIDGFMRSTSSIKSHYPEKGIGADQENSHCPKKGDAHRPDKGSHKALPQEGHCALPQEGQSNNQSTNLNPSTNNPSTIESAHSSAEQANPKKRNALSEDERILLNYGIDGDLAKDFIKHRRVKRSAITGTALDGIKREAEKAGIPFIEAVRYTIDASWIGFNADWYSSRQQKSPTPAANRKPSFRQAAEDQDYSSLYDGDFIDSTAKVIANEPV